MVRMMQFLNYHTQVHLYTQVYLYFSLHSFILKFTWEKGPVKCVFCQAAHQSDRCNVISDFETSKEFLKRKKRCFWRLKPDHNSKKCHKTKPCFYCKCIHNSPICSNREVLKKLNRTLRQELQLLQIMHEMFWKIQ